MSVIDVDEDQADWGSTRLYGDGDLPGLWVPDKGIGHWGGATTPAVTHAGCRRIFRGWQRFHIGKGWRDIAYNYAYCNHGVTFRARGWNPSGATSGDWEGDGIRENAEAVAIVWVGGSGGSITPAGFGAAGDLWRQVQAVIGATPQVGIGHRDVKSTSCPGNQYYDWVWRKGWVITPPPPPPDTTIEADMLPLFYGDGVKNGTTLTHPASGNQFVTKRQAKASDVAAVQGMLRRAGTTVAMTHGVYDEAMARALAEVTPDTAAAHPYGFGGDDWDPVLHAAYSGRAAKGLQDGDTVKLVKQ